MSVGQISIIQNTIGCKLQCDSCGYHIMRRESWEVSVFRKVYGHIHHPNFLNHL